MTKNGKSNNNRLRVCRVVDVPLEEVSGICSHRSPDGRVYLSAVGDRLAKIAWFSPPRSNEGQIDWHTRDIAELSDSMLPKHDPQIEAISADGLGRIALLQETPPRVELIDPMTSKSGRVDRSRGRGRSDIAQAWSDPEGSRGAGILLLPGGNLLVAKEKKPSCLEARSREQCTGGLNRPPFSVRERGTAGQAPRPRMWRAKFNKRRFQCSDRPIPTYIVPFKLAAPDAG
jgi:hypothetical protein